ncbi:MAG TPA: DUF5131 family protein [Dehalococcoidia bacterium]|nr:DUF5131 family protein [Dehalococcoidia bacterium]
MTLNKAKGRMFKSVGWTWNPIWGCTHDCKYCWARALTERWGKEFHPQFREKFLEDPMPNDESWIFVGSMGDVFCDEVPDSWLYQLILTILRDNSNNKFLLQSKNPRRFLDKDLDLDAVKEKVILGTTIETNRLTPWTKAPSTHERAYCLSQMKLNGFKTFLSLEPLSDFDFGELASWIMSIQPEAIEIGLENYTSHTTRPTDEKICQLTNWLDKTWFEYILKENVESICCAELRRPE